MWVRLLWAEGMCVIVRAPPHPSLRPQGRGSSILQHTSFPAPAASSTLPGHDAMEAIVSLPNNQVSGGHHCTECRAPSRHR